MASRISIRKIIQTLVTLVAVAGCAVAMISADRQQSRRKVAGVQLVVKSPSGVHFLTEDAVRGMLFSARHIEPSKLAVAQLDERSMEAILRTNPWVKDAQVYTDAARVMHISVTQRVPVVRIFEEDGNSYYLDRELKAMPLSAQYTHYTPVVTGVPTLTGDSVGTTIRGTIVGLIDHIAHDTFWNAQVSQLNMRADGGYELMPVLGRQRIILGDTTRLQSKLNNLFAFYKQVLSKVGWDKYDALDLRYEGQVVATPTLPWKAPVDKALSNMNWVKAIMDNAPARQAQLGGDAAAKSDSVSETVNRLPAQLTASADTPKRQGPPPRTQKFPAAPPPKMPKPPAKKASKMPLTAKPQKTTNHNQNTPQHAVPKR